MREEKTYEDGILVSHQIDGIEQLANKRILQCEGILRYHQGMVSYYESELKRLKEDN